MSSIFGMLNVSRRAMDAGQWGVQIAQHNLANINTPGYTRQELILTPARTVATGIGEIGMGVQIDQIRRVTDEFLRAALRNERSEYHEWQSTANVLDRVEILTSIDEQGSLSAALTDFFNAFEQLSTNVEDDSIRSVVVNAAVTLSERFQSLSSGLDRVRSELDEEVTRQTGEVTDILAGVAALNRQIIAQDTNETKANDLKVRRDALLDQLSGLVKYRAEEDKFGSVDISIAGRNVVHRDSAVEITPTPGVTVSGQFQTIQINVDGFYLAAERVGGSLGALIETRDTELTSVQAALDKLAGAVIKKVNELHEKGFSPAGSGVTFFEGTDARSIKVYQLLRDRPEFVAHSYFNAAGDNSLAADIAGLRDTQFDELGGRTPVGFYANLIGEVGSLSRTAKTMVENKRLTTGELTTRLESVAGVSLDEELTNVTRYQTMYEAAARMINTVNSMLDTVLTLGGRQ